MTEIWKLTVQVENCGSSVPEASQRAKGWVFGHIRGWSHPSHSMYSLSYCVPGHHVKLVGPCCTTDNEQGGRQQIKVVSEHQVWSTQTNILVRSYTLSASVVEPELCQQTKKTGMPTPMEITS